MEVHKYVGDMLNRPRWSPTSWFIYSLSAVIVGVLALGFVVPKSITVEVDRIMQTSPTMLRARVSDIQKQHVWSWIGRQSEQWDYTKDPGTLLTKATWHDGIWMDRGTDVVIPGYEFNAIENEIRAIHPWEVLIRSKIGWEAEGDRIRVRWIARLVRPFPFHLVHLSNRSRERLKERMQESLNRLADEVEPTYLMAKWGVRRLRSTMLFCAPQTSLGSDGLSQIQEWSAALYEPMWTTNRDGESYICVTGRLASSVEDEHELDTLIHKSHVMIEMNRDDILTPDQQWSRLSNVLSSEKLEVEFLLESMIARTSDRDNRTTQRKIRFICQKKL